MKEFAIDIIKKLNKHNYTAYLAGGCVRDKLLKRVPNDYDVATNATPQEIIKLFPRTSPVGESFGVVIVVDTNNSNLQVEVATFRSDGVYEDGRHPSDIKFVSAQEDALRRDFTINGMFFDPIENRIIDYVGGQYDLKNGIVKTIGNPIDRFNEDYLRILRAIRFSCQLEFDIENETMEAIRNNAFLVILTSKERIREEITKILLGSNIFHGFELLEESNILRHILPEISNLKGVAQNPKHHPEGDVWNHIMLILQYLEVVGNTSSELAWACLLHDIGKPECFSIGDYKNVCAFGHDKVGERISKEILERFKFSNDFIERVSNNISNHMNFRNVKTMKKSKLKRFFMQSHFDEMLLLHRLDCYSSNKVLNDYDFCVEKIQEFKDNNELVFEVKKPRSKYINGNDLITMNLIQGPIYSIILNKVLDEELEGNIDSKAEAVVFVTRFVEEIKED